MLDGGGSVVLRRDQARLRLARLSAEVETWLAAWTDDSPQSSQIGRCAGLMQDLVAALAARATAIDAAKVFEQCRALDSDVAVVDRLFRLYRDRFDQRRSGDEPSRKALRAVDELIWSCMLQVQPVAGQAKLPLPLAYLDTAYAPMATPRTKAPTQLPTRDRKLAEAFRMLPIPLIALPYAIVDEPWWMVLVAHEVGHHVQFDLAPGLVEATGKALAAAAPEEDAWIDWRFELFADVFAVVALGPTAIVATAELEWDTPAGLVAPRDLYPPVMVRLAVMSAIAARVGYADAPYAHDTWRDTLDAAGLDAAGRARLDAMLAAVDGVAEALWTLPAAGFAQMADRAAPSVLDGTGNGVLATRVLKGQAAGVVRGRGEPRRAGALAFAAYRGLAAIPDAQRDDRLRELATNTVALAIAAGDNQVKRATHVAPPTGDYVQHVCDMFAEMGT